MKDADEEIMLEAAGLACLIVYKIRCETWYRSLRFVIRIETNQFKDERGP